MNKNKIKLIAAAAASFVVGILFCALLLGLLCGGGSGLKNTLKFAEAMGIVRREYVAEADLDAMTDTALSAAFSTLDDWSYYMTAEQYDDYVDYTNNRYQGIGVTVSKTESGGFEVLGLSAGGPAALAGVVIGDIIIACDGTDVTDKTTEELRELIGADYGGEVQLTLQSPEGAVRELSVSCTDIETEAVSWEMQDDGIGYLRIQNFESGVGDSAIEAIETLAAEGAEAVIIDVRSNPGGRVTELCQLLDYLLPEGEIFIRADKQGNEAAEISDGEWNEIPLAVLVDSDSYSAAEFFAAALDEYDRAIIVGEATTGKGRSQLTYRLTDGGAIHLSHYVYLTPQRVDLSQTGGIVPEIELSLTDEQRSAFAAGQLAPEEDSQRIAAADALKS